MDLCNRIIKSIITTSLFLIFNYTYSLNWGYFGYAAKTDNGYVTGQIGICSEDLNTGKVLNSCPGYQNQGCTALINTLSSFYPEVGTVNKNNLPEHTGSLFSADRCSGTPTDMKLYDASGKPIKIISPSICPSADGDDIAKQYNTPCWRDTSTSQINCMCPLPSLRNELYIADQSQYNRKITLKNNCNYVVSPAWTSGAIQNTRTITANDFRLEHCAQKRSYMQKLLGQKKLNCTTDFGRDQTNCDNICINPATQKFDLCKNVKHDPLYPLPTTSAPNIVINPNQTLNFAHNINLLAMNDACGAIPPEMAWNGALFPRICKNLKTGELLTNWQDGVKCEGDWTELPTRTHTPFEQMGTDPAGANDGPATRFEYSLLSGTGESSAGDVYNSSIINGFNVPMSISIDGKQISQQTPITDFTCGAVGGYKAADPWTMNDEIQFGKNAWQFAGTLVNQPSAEYTEITNLDILILDSSITSLYLFMNTNSERKLYYKAGETISQLNFTQAPPPLFTLSEVCSIIDTSHTNQKCAAVACAGSFNAAGFTDQYKTNTSPQKDLGSQCGCTNFNIDLKTFIPTAMCAYPNQDPQINAYCSQHECFNANSKWIAQALNNNGIDYLTPLQKISLTTYSYPYGDKNATFTCPNIKYTQSTTNQNNAATCAVGLCPPYLDAPSFYTPPSGILPRGFTYLNTKQTPFTIPKLLNAINQVDYTVTFCPFTTATTDYAQSASIGNFALSTTPAKLPSEAKNKVNINSNDLIIKPVVTTPSSKVSSKTSSNFAQNTSSQPLNDVNFSAQGQPQRDTSQLAAKLKTITLSDSSTKAPNREYKLPIPIQAPTLTCAQKTLWTNFTIGAQPARITAPGESSIKIKDGFAVKAQGCKNPSVTVQYSIDDNFLPITQEMTYSDNTYGAVKFSTSGNTKPGSVANIKANITKISWEDGSSNLQRNLPSATTTIKVQEQNHDLIPCNNTAYDTKITITPNASSLKIGDTLSATCNSTVKNTNINCNATKHSIVSEPSGAKAGFIPVNKNCTSNAAIFKANSIGQHKIYGIVNILWSDHTSTNAISPTQNITVTGDAQTLKFN